MDLQFQVHFNIYLYMYIPIFLLLEFLCGFFFVKPCFMTIYEYINDRVSRGMY